MRPYSLVPARTAAISILWLVFCLLVLCFAGTGLAQQHGPQSARVWALPQVGPPTTNVLLQGAGFDPLTAIDVYFDTTVLTSTTTDKNGSFGNGVITATGATWTRLQVPSTALPGQHTITAQQRVGQNSAQIAFLVRTNWPQFGFNPQHTGANAYENVLSTGNVGTLTSQWIYTPESQINSSATIADGVVYAGSFAVDASTGTLLWNFPCATVLASPAVANGVDYIPCNDGWLYAVDAKTGVLVWRRPYGGGQSSPAVVNGVVYITSQNRAGLYAFNASTGTPLWGFMGGGGLASSPAVANGVVYVGSMSGYLYAVDAGTGAELWENGSLGVFISAPSVANGMVYVGSYHGSYDVVSAVDAGTGALRWTYPTGSPVPLLAVSAGVVYVASDNVYALDAISGALLWKGTLGGTSGSSSPAVANGVLYIGLADYYLYALDASSGGLLWKYGTGADNYSPIVANGTVYMGSANNNLYAFGLPSQQKSTKNAERPEPARLKPEWSLLPKPGASR